MPLERRHPAPSPEVIHIPVALPKLEIGSGMGPLPLHNPNLFGHPASTASRRLRANARRILTPVCAVMND